MKVFDELLEQNLRWVQTSALKQDYELRTDDDEVLATIHQASMWRSMVEVEAVGNRWTFERKGFWGQHIEIKSVGTQAQPAVFTYNGMSGGKLTFTDGRTFNWKQSNFWGSKWGWATPDDEPIVGFKTGGLFKINSEISLDPGVVDMPSLPLLLMLGWYLYTLYVQDSSAVIVAT